MANGYPQAPAATGVLTGPQAGYYGSGVPGAQRVRRTGTPVQRIAGYLTGPQAARALPPNAGPTQLAAQAAFVQPGPVNAWDPYMALSLGLNPTPPAFCQVYSTALNVSPAPPPPGTPMTGAVALFTPLPARPGTGPGVDSSIYLNTFGAGSAANRVNWTGRTPRAFPS